MNAFDDEPNPGGGYERAIARPILHDDGIPRRVVVRLRGRPVERVSIILEEVRDGERGALMRYDDAHGRFHRHMPGWPEPSERIEAFLNDVPALQRAIFADAEIRLRYNAWEADVFGQEGAGPK